MSAATLYLKSFAEAVRPRPPLTVAEVVAGNRLLSSKGSQFHGPWSHRLTPYLVEPMEALSCRSGVAEVVFMSAIQVAKTELGLNWIFYTMSHEPGPMLAVFATVEQAQRWEIQRLSPMIRENPLLADKVETERRRTRRAKSNIIDYPGGLVVISGANSPASLESMPIRYVLCDELDRFKWSFGDGGDPLGSIEGRQTTYIRTGAAKRLLTSSPGPKSRSRIWQRFQDTDQRRWLVICPVCSSKIQLHYQHLRLSKSGALVHHVCPVCADPIPESRRDEMLESGRWEPTASSRDRRGYQLGAVQTALQIGLPWAQLAADWISVQGDPIKKNEYICLRGGEPYEEEIRDIQAGTVQQLAEDYPLRFAPRGCLILTAGIDVQADRLAMQIVGWGRARRFWVLDWVEIPGDTGGDEIWHQLETWLNKPIHNDFGQSLRVRATGVDSGFNKLRVYEFVRQQRVSLPIAMKGASDHQAPIFGARGTWQDFTWRGTPYPRGVKLHLMGASQAKHYLYQVLAASKPPGERLAHFSTALPWDYFQQLTAETFLVHSQKWVKRPGQSRNEALDTFNLALAAALHPSIAIDRLGPDDWDRIEQIYEPKQAPNDPPKPKVGETKVSTVNQSSWIGQRRR